MSTTNVEIVSAAFEAYRTQDRAAAEPLYADDFTFTSPQDDHIDRAAFFERCFPTAWRFSEQRITHVVNADEDLVFVYYEYDLVDGPTHRNMEAITVRGGQIREVQVFFGGAVPVPS
jgi:ketosteroid isomerase-like protein